MIALIFFLVVRCPFVPPPLNCFQLGCRDNVFGDKCRFFCNIGYRLISGSMVRTCQANGTWSGEIPDCQGKLKSLINKLVVLMGSRPR